MDALVYVRHGHDEKSKYPFDARLTSEGAKMSKQLAKRLLRKYGLPSVIFCSPFERARKTAIVMKKAVVREWSKHHPGEVVPDIAVFTDVRLGRHFTKRQRESKVALSKTTAKNGAIVQETNAEFHERVIDQLFERLVNDDEYKVVWNVSHSLVLLKVAQEMRIRRSKHVNFLDTVVVKQT